MEAKMSEVLSKISALELMNAAAPPSPPREANDPEVKISSRETRERSEDRQRLKDLELQISSITQKRLDHLERLQRQQMQVQVSVTVLFMELFCI